MTVSMIISDLIVRVRDAHGHYRAGDYREFVAMLGLTIEFRSLGSRIPAMLCDDTIVINPDVVKTESDIAWWVFHEAAHWLLHEGSRSDYTGTSDGRYALGKYERQCNEFAAHYPEWERIPPAAMKHADMFRVFVED